MDKMKFDLQLFAVTTMNAKDALSAKLASIYLTVGSDRFLLLNAKEFEAKIEKEKTEVPILGRMQKGHKATSLNGTGSLLVYHNSPIFTNMLKKLQQTGEDTYFDLLVVNEDPTSAAGRLATSFSGCNIDGGTIASFNADGEYLEQPLDFTFESFEILENFALLPGMKQ